MKGRRQLSYMLNNRRATALPNGSENPYQSNAPTLSAYFNRTMKTLPRDFSICRRLYSRGHVTTGKQSVRLSNSI